jgi:iron(III) transport system substrate-binding protein
MPRTITRRHVLKAGSALAATAIAAPRVSAQGAKTPTKVLDFTTFADVAKAEQEGQLVFYCHENEAGTAAIMEGFGKDFPKIKTSYVRAQTGALYNKILSERSAGRFDVDVIQLSDVAPAVTKFMSGPSTAPTRRTMSARHPAPISGPA